MRIKSAPKHTPGPWAIYRGEGSPIAVVSNGNENVNKRRTLAMVGPPHVSKSLTMAELEANAARIVACVNALEGIESPEALRKALIELRDAWRGDSTKRVELAYDAIVGIALALEGK